MASHDSGGHLVASIKEAENEAEHGESFLLVQLVTAATLDDNPRYSLREVYDALQDAKAWSLLDPLNLLPLLVPSDNVATSDMIELIATEGNAKETIISVQELLELLEKNVKVEGRKHVLQLTRLLDVCRGSFPRLRIRNKGPAETLRPILTHLGAAVESVAPLADKDDGRNLISSVSKLIQRTLPWLLQNARASDPSNQAATELLSNLLCDTLAACATHIRSSIAQRRFEVYNPRLVLRSTILADYRNGEEVVQEALATAKTVGLTPNVLASRPLSLGKLILLAHEEPALVFISSDFLQDLVPILTSSLQQNIATDEALAFMLVCLSASTYQLPPEVVDSLATITTPLASTHPDPSTRHITFRILAILLSRAPPPVHLAHLSSLLADCPFPQMRVAAVGLVKEAFLSAIVSTGHEQSPFKSATLVQALGPTLFRPIPPNLFDSPTKQSLRKFLESSEPARLTECLAFYYVLLKRDTQNCTRIRDRDMIRTVETGLLAPLRKALAIWQEELPSENSESLLPIASLGISLERVDAVVAALRSS